MKVMIVNQGLSNENLGDRKILITLENIFYDLGCKVETNGFTQLNKTNMPEITALNQRNKVLITLKNSLKKLIPKKIVFDLKYRKNIKNTITYKIKEFNPDIIVIGGGQLLKTNSVFPYALSFWVKQIKRLSDAKIYLLGVGADKNFTRRESRIIEEALSHIEASYIRDYDSLKTLNKFFSNYNFRYIPDLVFYNYNYNYKIKKERSLTICIFSRNSYNNNKGINLSQTEYYEIWESYINKNRRNNEKIKLAYTSSTDKIETLMFNQYLLNKGYKDIELVLTDELYLFENLMLSSRLLISGRMHGLLLGIINHVEVVPIIVNDKLKTFQYEWVDNKTGIDYIEAKEKIRNSLTNIVNNI